MTVNSSRLRSYWFTFNPNLKIFLTQPNCDRIELQIVDDLSPISRGRQLCNFGAILDNLNPSRGSTATRRDT